MTVIMSGAGGSETVKTEVPDVKPSAKLLDQLIKSQRGASGHLRMSHMNGQDPYVHKLRSLKKAIKDVIFMNGTICDEVLRTEEKLAKAKEERRFLLRKLLQYQNIHESSLPSTKSESHGSGSSKKAPMSSQPSHDGAPPDQPAAPKSSKASRRTKQTPASIASGASAGALTAPATSSQAVVSGSSGGPSEAKKRGPSSSKELTDTLHPRPKKSKGVNRKVIPPLMLDPLGRPVIPMFLGDITLHSIGEIIPDRSMFHCQESIYPVGFCITRVYASLHKLDSKCLYTCKISDNNDGPLFEIAAEDNSDVVFKGHSPSDCHSLLLRAVNKIRGDLLPLEGKGLDFFGLSHPVIQNLIQSCPGARKCPGYKWVKFEINKAETNENLSVGISDPTVSYDAFKAHLVLVGHRFPGLVAQIDQSTSLRSLLTKGSGHPS